jgi:hypothetical protein
MLTGSTGQIEIQIKDWVRKHVCTVDPDDGRCKKLVVRHINIDRKPSGDVATVNIPSDPAYEGTEMADKVIVEIADVAQRDADDLKSGVQTYGIFAYYTKNERFVPRKLFRVAAQDDFEPESGPSEPPTEKGLMTQLMRHNEINSKNSLVAMGYIMQTFQKEISEQRANGRKFFEQQVDLIMLVQEMMNDGHKRRQDEKKTDMEMSILEGTFEHLKIILPIIANKLMGKEVFPAKMDRELYVMASLMETLTEQQQTELRNMLSPQQLSILAEFLGMYEERKNKLTGEKSENEEPSGGKKKEKSLEGVAAPGSPKKNRLITLFEKRTNIVKSGSNLTVTDDVTRRMEERAARIVARGTERDSDTEK